MGKDPSARFHFIMERADEAESSTSETTDHREPAAGFVPDFFRTKRRLRG